MTEHVRRYAQTWPLCWQLMQRDLILWVCLAKPATHITVTWNEATLNGQATSKEFLDGTQDFKAALSQQLGVRLTWRIDTQSPAAAHVIDVRTKPAVKDQRT